MTRSCIVHLIDRDEGVLRAMARTLERTGYKVLCFTSAADFLANGFAARPDCIVSEASLECSGLELQERLHERDATLCTVFVTGIGDFRFAVRAIRAGAVDVLEKPVADASLLDAVKRAVERSRALRASAQARSTALERFALLTPRERDIFVQVLEGRLNKQIAATLDCEEATVKVHRSRLMRKLGVRSLARLVRFGQEIGAA